MSTYYTRTHEWIRLEGEDEGIVGVTQRRILEYGEVVAVELPEVGAEYEQHEPIGVIETIEGQEYYYRAPVSGEVLEVNAALEEDPTLLNQSAEDEGWIFRMRIEFPGELDDLMDAEEYEFYEEDSEEEYEEDEEF
ncbi:MAG: glycine cleavage system H protein [Candidatus Poribacteria bacterium]|nr:MAG: glycine cleavage system H protein [Candidatus Poribacteria bacterium]